MFLGRIKQKLWWKLEDIEKDLERGGIWTKIGKANSTISIL